MQVHVNDKNQKRRNDKAHGKMSDKVITQPLINPMVSNDKQGWDEIFRFIWSMK